MNVIVMVNSVVMKEGMLLIVIVLMVNLLWFVNVYYELC